MKLNSALLALGATVVSGTLVVRDLQTVQGVISQVQTQVGALKSAVDSYSGDPGPLTSANEQILSILRDGTSKISATSELSQTDALGLTGPVQGLASAVDGAVSALIGKKDAFVSAGQGGTILAALQAQKSGSDALSAAITSKVPQALQSIASQLSGQIITSLDKGIAAFQGTGGPPPVSGPGGAPPAKGTPSAPAPVVGGGSAPLTPTPGFSTPSATGVASPPVQFTGAAAAVGVPHLMAIGAAVVGLVV